MKVQEADIHNIAGVQAIPLPEAFKIDDNKVYLKKAGNVIYIIPFHNPCQSLYDSLTQFTNDYMQERQQPYGQSRESFD